MPGFSPKPPLTHRAQIIQPPRLAWVDANCADDDIILDRKRKWKEPLSEGAIPLTTNQMHWVSMKDRRMVDISKHYKHLLAKQQLAKECAQNYVVKNPSDPDDKAPPEIEYDESTMSFMNLVVEEASQQFKCADLFERDMVENFNPKAGSVDQMFAEKSKHIMMMQKCAYEAYGKNSSKSVPPNQAVVISRMVELWVKTDIFGSDEGRKMTPDFFWNNVQKPKKVGTPKAHDYENPEMTPAKKLIFSRLCGSEDDRDDFDDFELETGKDDDDMLSQASSCFERSDSGRNHVAVSYNDGPADEDGDETKPPIPDWELLTETEKEGQISDNLKKTWQRQEEEDVSPYFERYPWS